MRSFLCSVAIVLMSLGVSAQSYRNEFGFRTDNDSYLFNGSDRYYTNGLFFYFNHALNVKKDSSSLANKILGFEIGQKIYNPQSGVIPEVYYDDRPFAGYLYGAVNLNLLYKDESNLKLTAAFGVVGPASLAQQSQDFVHNLFGQYAADGWQYQIKDNVELNLSAEYNRLLTRGKGIDLSLAAYGNLGMGFTGAGIGPMVRLGRFNQLFFSESTQSTVTANTALKSLHNSELYFYIKPQFNWIAYDATIQGGLGQTNAALAENYFGTNDVTRHIEPLMYTQQIGGVYSSNRWVFDLYVLWETKDTKEMVHDWHQWGALQVLYKFN